MNDAFTPELLKRIIDNQSDYTQPLLFVGARIHLFDSVVDERRMQTPSRRGLHRRNRPGIVTAAGDDNALVIDCTGMVIAPVQIDARAALSLNPDRSSDVGNFGEEQGELRGCRR